MLWQRYKIYSCTSNNKCYGHYWEEVWTLDTKVFAILPALKVSCHSFITQLLPALLAISSGTI